MDEEKRIDRLHLGIVLLVFVLGVVAIVEGFQIADWKRILGEYGIALSVAAAYALIEISMHIDLPTILSTRITKTSKGVLEAVQKTSTEVVEEMEFMKDIYRTGVTRVFPIASSASMFEGADRCSQIWMIFNTGRSFAYNQAPVIHRMLAEGKGHVRILIADGQQSFWEDEDVLHGNGVISEVHEIRLTLSKIRDIQKDLDSKCDKQTENGQKMSSLTKRIEIRKYKCVPQCSMFIFDDSYAWIIPYLPYQSSANLPAWRVDDGRGNLFQIYKAMYQDVWDRSIPIDNLDGEVEGLKKGEKVRSSSFR